MGVPPPGPRQRHRQRRPFGMVDEPAEKRARTLPVGRRRARAFPALGPAMPPYRIVKEKRATIRQSPTEEAIRPGAETAYKPICGSPGDWTRTGLPATIEGSLLSGFHAARLARESPTALGSSPSNKRRAQIALGEASDDDHDNLLTRHFGPAANLDGGGQCRAGRDADRQTLDPCAQPRGIDAPWCWKSG